MYIWLVNTLYIWYCVIKMMKFCFSKKECLFRLQYEKMTIERLRQNRRFHLNLLNEELFLRHSRSFLVVWPLKWTAKGIRLHVFLLCVLQLFFLFPLPICGLQIPRIPGIQLQLGWKNIFLPILCIYHFFPFSLEPAAAPANLEVWQTYDWHSVSATVTSHIKLFPFFQVVNVKPSGLKPFEVDSFESSVIAGFFDWTSALFNKLLISSCLERRPICCKWHNNPCLPYGSTSLPLKV